MLGLIPFQRGNIFKIDLRGIPSIDDRLNPLSAGQYFQNHSVCQASRPSLGLIPFQRGNIFKRSQLDQGRNIRSLIPFQRGNIFKKKMIPGIWSKTGLIPFQRGNIFKTAEQVEAGVVDLA